MTATSFTIKWVESESDGGSAILEYIVEMKEATLQHYKKAGATRGTITEYAVNYLEKDHGYNFRIYARNEVGLSEPYIPEDTIVAGARLSKFIAKKCKTALVLLKEYTEYSLQKKILRHAHHQLIFTETTGYLQN